MKSSNLKQLDVRELVSFVSTAVWSDIYFPLVVDWRHCNYFFFLQISNRIVLKAVFLFFFTLTLIFHFSKVF